MWYGVQELLRPVLTEVLDRPQGFRVAVMCLTEHIVERADINPIAGLGLGSELDSTPVSERDTEPSPDHRPDQFIQARWPINKGVAQGLADVFGNVPPDASVVVDELYIYDHRIPGNFPPCT